MRFLEFWKPSLNKEEIQAVKFLESQILALDSKWAQFARHNFTDWNQKFRGLKLDNISPKMQIPMRDAKIEKKEFGELWKRTSFLFSKTVKLINKGKTEDAIIMLYGNLNQFEKIIKQLENAERKTYRFLQEHSQMFQPLFDNNYGKGYFENEVLPNYEVRFNLLDVLKNQYEMIRHILSDVV